MSGYRLAEGGARIDRARPLRFTFDGQDVEGFAGDSVASALLASGQRLLARSFKYHRPRGLLSAGPEEPNALVTLGEGARLEPNTRATMAEAADRLVVRSQNAWPSLKADVAALANGLLSPFFGAGFYYKTFMSPVRGGWMLFEPSVRRAAGLGRGSFQPDPDRYDKASAFADVVVVGGGAAGIAAALAAGRAGARVILADENAAMGGAIDLYDGTVDGAPAGAWAAEALRELTDLPQVRVLPRTTVWGYYDANVLGAVERVADGPGGGRAGLPRLRHWRFAAPRIVLATGAFERPLVFPGNDRPGVMLLSAALAYARRYGVGVGRDVVVFANNDGAWRHALALSREGVAIRAMVDPRTLVAQEPADALEKAGARILTGHVVVGTKGRADLRGVHVAPLAGLEPSAASTIFCDTLLLSGGWTPNINLASQAGDVPVYDREVASFLPGRPRDPWIAAGAGAGQFALEDALASGAEAGAEAARASGFEAEPPRFAAESEGASDRAMPLWEVPAGLAGRKHGKAFVDFQNDVTADDLRLAHREGFSSVEHLKRYTTLGMATDQGKTSNLNGLAIMAEARGISIPEVGATRFRPPYTPVTLGALAGRETGLHFRPLRRTPMHDWHVRAGADMLNVGAWQRPLAYRRPGESLSDAYVREMEAVRGGVAIADVSTLGKIAVDGPDAAVFLDRVYTNTFSTLPVGKARYGLMLREDGFLFDDGTTWRLSETRYLMTTTTANAGEVLAFLEYLLATAWPELKVSVASLTDRYAAIAVSGPKSRVLLEGVVEGVDMANSAFPPLGIRPARVEGTLVWIARLSFSGELAYEVYVGPDHGEALWTLLLEAGRPFGVIPYGLEALGALRIEKGHVTGSEIDGRTSVHDLGLEKMFSMKKDFVGKALALRPALTDAARKQLVGLVSLDGRPLRPGAHLVAAGDPGVPGVSQGHVTSTTYSPALDRFIALALVERGRARHGETLVAADPIRNAQARVEIRSPHFYDPDGSRMNA